MNIHVLMPSRRAQKMMRAVRAYMGSVSGQHAVTIGVAIDEDDRESMNALLTGGDVNLAFGGTAGVYVSVSAARGKVAAYNNAFSMIEQFGLDPDVVIYGSDDLMPVRSGWDQAIAQLMDKAWPGMDGALFLPAQHPARLMTMPIIGRGLLPALGHAYEPGYRTEWCDNELHNVLQMRGRLAYAPVQVFQHEHPALGTGDVDDLYAANAKGAPADHALYLSRAASGFGWPAVSLSLLIPTLPYRRPLLRRLMVEIARQLRALGPGTARRVETIVCETTGRESTGSARNRLLHRANGEYVAFIDDDDMISDGYVASLLAEIDKPDKPDSVGFFVQHTLNGTPQCVYSMSREFDAPTETGRPINHLAATRRCLAVAAGFPDKTLAEDKAYSEALLHLLNRCAMVPRVLYTYHDCRYKPHAVERWPSLPGVNVPDPAMLLRVAAPAGKVAGE